MDLRERIFGYYLPTINLMGVGASAHTAKQIKSLGGTRVLLVTDKGLVATGIAAEIQQQLKDAGIEVLLFDKVQPNPTDLNVHDGLKAYQENQCDCIVSLGGGSAHDCAKGIGIVAANGGDIRDFEGVDNPLNLCRPLSLLTRQRVQEAK
jgi:alcohol dehydrogenase